MGIGLLVSFVGVFVAGLAGVLGVWMERDSAGRMIWPVFFSMIILAATGVEMIHSVFQEVQESRTEAQMATLLGQLTTLSEHNPELQQYVAAELAVQERTNPGVVNKLERQVAASGGDPNAVRQMAAAGRRQQAGGDGGNARPRPQPRPKAKAKAGGDEGGAKAGAAAAPAPAPAASVAAAAASGDPDAAMAAAQAEADKMLADAQAEADAVKAEAEKVKAQADKALKQAERLKKQAEDALKNIPGVGGGGGGGGKGGGGKGGAPKIPGL